MFPLSESVKMVDNNPIMQKRIALFTELMKKGIDEGLSYHGYPAVVTRRIDDDAAFLRCNIEGENKSLSAKLPKVLFEAGYRFEQFGSLFISNFNFSNGEELVSSLKTNIAVFLKSHGDTSIEYDINGVALTIIGRIVKPFSPK